MSRIRNMYGPARDDIWQQLAEQLGGTFEKGKWFGSPAVRCQAGSWEIVLDSYERHNNNSHHSYTRLRAPFLNKNGMNLKIYQEHFFARMGKKLGLQDIQTGYKDFDEAFIVQSNSSDHVKQLLREQSIRQLMLETPKMVLTIRDNEGIFAKKYPKGVDVLHAYRHGIVKNLDELKLLYALFASILERMVVINAAYDQDPGFKI